MNAYKRSRTGSGFGHALLACLVSGALVWQAGAEPGGVPRVHAVAQAVASRPAPETPGKKAVNGTGATRVAQAPPGTSALPNGPITLTSNDPARDEQPLFLDYQDTELADVVKAIGALTGKNFDIDPTLAQNKVTIVSNGEVPKAMAYEVLEAIVASKGGHMVEDVDGHLVKIVPAGKNMEQSPVIAEATEAPEGYDRFLTYIVGVQHADVEDVAGIMTSLGSEFSRVDAYAVTNTLIITDTADGVRNMLKFLEKVDVPGFDAEVEIFGLEYARAEVLATQILDVLGWEEGDTQASSRAQQIRQAAAASRTRRAVPTQKTPAIVGKREETLRIVPDERLNALVVVATEGMMEQVRALVEELDTEPRVESNNMHVYHLLNADAAELSEALAGFVEGATPRQSGQGGQGGGQTGDVQPFEKTVKITSYEQTNTLLILASPEDYKLVQAVIAQLDVPQRQVHVEAIIAKVTINDNFVLSVETAGLTANDAFTLNNITQLANVLNGNILGSDGPAQSSVLAFGVLDGTTEIPVSDGSGGIVVQTVPNVPLLLTALDHLTALDVLSRPSLTTVDNEEASILIGQDVPFVSGSQSSLNQTSTNSSIYNSIDREDVGIKMTVTPQISEGDYVLLELGVEVSAQASASTTVGDPNLLGPTLDKTEIQDKVVIRNGSTGLVGGLISESMDRSRRHTPYAGDLPLLGWLFGRRSTTRRKENLIVLVTPNIIKSGTDIDRLTEFKTDEVHRANADVMFEHGFIKKLKKKHYLRKNHRPGQMFLEEFQGEDEGFDRGEAES